MDRDSLEQASIATKAPDPRRSWRLPACAGLLALVAASGCAATGTFGRNDIGQPMPANAPVEEVVRRLNANIERLQAWRSNDVRISGQSMPVHLGGHIAVESPRNFRLTAGLLGMDEEADFGSNSEWFWFWVKRGNAQGQPSYVYQAKHEDVATSQMLSQIPFQPDWLMEALGVVPIDPQHVTLHIDGKYPQIANLISERLSPSGQTVKKVISVDLRRGIVLSHSLYDINGTLIAKARLDKHYLDKATGIPMPHLIALEWPQADLRINLEIGQIDVNPTSIPPQNWVVPRKPYYPAFDIGARTRKPSSQMAVTPSAPKREVNAVSDSPATSGPPADFGAPSPVTSVSGQISTPASKNAASWPESTSSDEWSKPIQGGASTPIGGSRASANPFDRDPVPQPLPKTPPASGARGPSADPFAEPTTSPIPAAPPSPASSSSGFGSSDPFNPPN